MSNYYVSPSGSDGNNGLGAPFASIQKGINAAQPGDAITLQGRFGPGQTCNINKAGSQGAPITLLGQGATLDGQGSISRWVDFQGGSAWWIVQDLEIMGALNGGVWANSGGAQNITCRNLHIHHIGGAYDGSTYGIVGIYTDASGVMRVEGCNIHSIGRSGGGNNSYDHGIYSHGHIDIIGNQFSDSRQGWHIQTADGYSGSIQGNSFDGPNLFPNKDGQIMLWGACGPIDISGNAFNNLGGGPAIVDVGFSSPRITINGNSVSGGTIGGPAGAVFGSGSSPAPQQQSSGGGSSPVIVSTQGPNPLSGALSQLQGAVSGISPTMLWVGGALLVIMLTDD